MARGGSIEAELEPTEVEGVATGEFGAEFRELARQRRFVRSSGEPDLAPGTPRWEPAIEPTRRAASIAEPDTDRDSSMDPSRSTRSSRMSDDQRAMIGELSRMSDRLVESREALATMTVRAEHAEAGLASANDRLMAARVLVQDAQRATHETAERCAWLEGRCDTLQEALELAVNASIVTRWRWRRESRRAT